MTAQPLSPAKIYAQAELDALGDEALVELVRGRSELAVRTLTRRYNRRLFRIARSVLCNGAEAEDVVQESWVRAFAGLDGFRGESAFATWLTRIAINEALGRKRRLRPTVDWETYSENKREAEIIQFPASAVTGDPERTIARSEIREVLERSIDDLPETFRGVFVARIVEGMSVEETAELFELKQETVKTRLHRARNLLRDALDRQLGSSLTETFPFDGALCERVTDRVIERLKQLP